MNKRYGFVIALVTLFLAWPCSRLNAAPWLPFGPNGGDAREFASDPSDSSHLYLGTATGWMYESHDSGRSWKRLALIGDRDDLVLDSIAVDRTNPKHILVGAWVLSSPDGGLYTSNDGGATWSSNVDLRGQSILALSTAPSNPKILVAGTLKGVYRSTDGGDHWQLISPEGSRELHEVESIAIDPVDPQIIYAGTWHLPWKTVDGGKNWGNMNKGIAEDSDVFSIIVNPQDSKVVYASACSGIYKSVNSGTLFDRMHPEQGFPSTAHRTRVLMQDPKNMNIVFAGTTEGLYRTSSAGASWQRTTAPEVIVNDVYVDPNNTNRVLLATDRGGVLASNDGGMSFVPSNDGFSARQITSWVADAAQPARIYVGVVNDKTFGGVFFSEDGGLSWVQKNSGLNGHDVFSMGEAADGSVLAGTGHGIYRLQGEVWGRVDDVTVVAESAPVQPVARKPASAKTRAAQSADRRMAAPEKVKPFDGKIFAFSRSGDSLYAATSEGMLRSATAGQSWKLIQGLGKQEWNFVSASKSTVMAASLREAMLSTNGGETWVALKLPEAVHQLSAVSVDGMGGLWVSGRQGVFYSDDSGATWQTLKNLYVRDVTSLTYDEPSQRMLITSNDKNTIAFAVHLPDRMIQYWSTGWGLKLMRPVGDHLLGVTQFNGVVVQPQMVDSSKVSKAEVTGAKKE